MFKKLFARIVFHIYRKMLREVFNENRKEELSFYEEYPSHSMIGRLRDFEQIKEYNEWFIELSFNLKKAKTLKELIEVEAEWSENFDADAVLQILYQLDKWLKGNQHALS